MASPWLFAFLCGLLTAPLAGATLNSPAVLSLSSEIVKDKLTQELKNSDATQILQQLPLLSEIQKEPASDIPIIGNLVDYLLNHIVWLKVTSANILQLQVQPSANGQELVVKVPLSMVAGFNTPIVKTIVEMHMKTEIQANIQVQTSESGQPHLVLSDCSNSQDSLTITLLDKRLSFLVNSLAKEVMSLLMPALPKLVKSQLCPVIQKAFEDSREDLLNLVKVPVTLGPDHLEFDILSPAIKDNFIQLNLGVKFLDSQGKVTQWFNESAASLTMPTVVSAPFSLAFRQDVVNAAVGVLLPPGELMVLLNYVFPELAQQLKTSMKAINETAAEKLGPTQIVKILIQETPDIFLAQGSATAVQLIALELFATNEVSRPFFTLGIEASSEAQFYTEGDQLMLNLNEISSDRIYLMNSSFGLFNPDLLKDIVTQILASVLLPNENGKLRSGVQMSTVKAFGFESPSISLTKDALVITAAA
ncbi:BPI fold-containing family B member 1 [Manis pentadactyla]|uniref:BPI fold-containing family B member 1 n=1 Tax=Manis pentadactyla TaxID=143292 RepID=UPI00255CF627|nr:BPI fold-containing family B member 1 [Manis pentadactyla]KAI5216065.1 Bpi Fold-Containing Family B Member 1 [Manis pentadactyla]